MSVMKLKDAYKIPFKGLKLGKHKFDYQVDNTFFEAYKYNEFLDVDAKVSVVLTKKDTLLELHFNLEGFVRVNCDVSGEEFNQPVEGKMKLIVKFGNEFNDDNEDILIIPNNEYELDISQYLYELIIFGVPTKRIHPKVKDGTLKSIAQDKLEALQNKSKKSIDPRWEKLKGLIKD
jgi:uncharacterized metal-binding protein YceD (DUF177 family)